MTTRHYRDNRGGVVYPESFLNTLELKAYTPVVVINPADRGQVERLTAAYMEEWSRRVPDTDSLVAFATAMQAALRSLIEPPRPDEPRGLGAVVEDDRGERWLWTAQGAGGAHWLRVGWPELLANWSQFNAVKVLSEGVR